jgi:hypothetical protein
LVDSLGASKIKGYEVIVDKITNKIKLVNTPDGYRADGKITGKDLKMMAEAGLISYEHQKGFLQIDNERNKLAKVLNTAKWSDLETFSTLSGTRSDQSNTLKEFANTKENMNLLTTETVFDFLCDRNGDAVLSGSNKERVK